MESMRLFVAVELSLKTRQSLESLVSNLAASLTGNVRWTKGSNLHLTLKFLGDVSLNDVANVDLQINLAVESCSPFGFDVTGLGCFPDRKRPRVLWAGLDGYSESLMCTQGAIESALSGIGIRREKKKFSPHITLARINGLDDYSTLDQCLSKHATSFWGEEWVPEIVLMQSDLKRSGAEYTKIASYRLD